MKRVFDKIRRLISENAVHNRNGLKMGEVDLPTILAQAKAEFAELEAAPDDEQEMADLLCILFHYCIKQGWTEPLLQETMIEKMYVRF